MGIDASDGRQLPSLAQVRAVWAASQRSQRVESGPRPAVAEPRAVLLIRSRNAGWLLSRYVLRPVGAPFRRFSCLPPDRPKCEAPASPPRGVAQDMVEFTEKKWWMRQGLNL